MMETFKKHLQEKLQDEHFREMYDEERQLLEMAVKIVGTRKHFEHDLEDFQLTGPGRRPGVQRVNAVDVNFVGEVRLYENYEICLLAR